MPQGSTLAPSMAALIVCRAVQGAAMGAAVMCARAIVRDLHAPVQGARVISKVLGGLGVMAFLSAPTGERIRATRPFWRSQTCQLRCMAGCSPFFIMGHGIHQPCGQRRTFDLCTRACGTSCGLQQHRAPFTTLIPQQLGLTEAPEV